MESNMNYIFTIEQIKKMIIDMYREISPDVLTDADLLIIQKMLNCQISETEKSE